MTPFISRKDYNEIIQNVSKISGNIWITRREDKRYIVSSYHKILICLAIAFIFLYHILTIFPKSQVDTQIFFKGLSNLNAEDIKLLKATHNPYSVETAIFISLAAIIIISLIVHSYFTKIEPFVLLEDEIFSKVNSYLNEVNEQHKGISFRYNKKRQAIIVTLSFE